MSIIDAVINEMDSADYKYGSFKSTHEGLGVITEEYHELIEAIRGNYSESVRQEAIQVAAACLRLANQCRETGSFADRSGFGE